MNDVVAYLEGFLDGTGRVAHLPIRTLPCRIGRRVELELQLNDPRVSHLHAEIYFDRGQYFIRDLASTNGTFLNGQRLLGSAPIIDGDIIRFAVLEFRFSQAQPGDDLVAADRTAILSSDHFGRQLFGHRDLFTLIETESVIPYYQPIVRLSNDSLVGYELLGRGNAAGLPTLPGELFDMAATFGLEANLSELFRRVGVRAGAELTKDRLLFVNMHPAELEGTQLVQSLKELRRDFPDTAIVLELHESGITDSERIGQLRAQLVELGIGVAYDDFGAGQARLNELAEVPPDYIKFDVSLVRQIHQAPLAKRQLVERLVHFSRDLGVETIAECVELREERDVCEEIGFDLAQGFMFGRPEPITSTKPQRQQPDSSSI